MTVSLPLAEPLDRAALRALYAEAYREEPLVALTDESSRWCATRPTVRARPSAASRWIRRAGGRWWCRRSTTC